MNVLQSMIIAFSMYSKLPMPHIAWQEKNMKYAMCFFPMVGIVIGICEYALGSWILGRDYGVFVLFGMYDSASDPADRRHPSGWIYGHIGRTGVLRGREKKLAILKDSHTGAFAVWDLVSI